MAYDFSNMAAVEDKQPARKSGGKGTFIPNLNVPVRVTQVVVADDKKKTPTEDKIIGVLMAPAFGKKAGEEVVVKLKDRGPAADPDKIPTEIWDIQPGKKVKGRYTVGKNPAVIAENARPLDDNTIECGWIRVAEYEFNAKPAEKAVKDSLQYGMVTVGYLDERQNGIARQLRHLHFNDFAQVLTGRGEEAIANFKAMVVSMMENHADVAGGRTNVHIRMINNNDLTNPQSYKYATIYQGWNTDEQRPATGAESIERWLADQANVGWLENIIAYADDVAESNGTLEIWPCWTYEAGKMAVDREVKAKSLGRATVNSEYTAPDVDLTGEPVIEFNNDGSKSWHRNAYTLVTEGMHKLVLLDGRSEWIADTTMTLERYPNSFFKPEQLVTPNLTKAARDLFVGLAAKRGQFKREAFRASKEQKAAPANDASEAGQDFGGEAAPDPTAGAFKPR